MKKSELIKKIAALTGNTCRNVDEILDGLSVAINEELCAGGEVVIPNVGKLSVAHKPDRNGRNPATGESMVIPARTVVQFKVLKVLKDSVNK